MDPWRDINSFAIDTKTRRVNVAASKVSALGIRNVFATRQSRTPGARRCRDSSQAIISGLFLCTVLSAKLPGISEVLTRRVACAEFGQNSHTGERGSYP